MIGMHQVPISWSVLALVAFMLLVVLPRLGLLAKWLQRGKNRSEYQRVALLSLGETEFYRCLLELYGASAIVCPKVRLLDLVCPRKGLDRRQRQSALNRVWAKHVDFVVLRVDDFSVWGVVELDDRSHDRQDRAGRDAFKDDALRQGGIPVCRVRAKRHYDLNELWHQLNEAFAPTVSETAGA
jgi:very-short-patch-repair endonuclease